jgi:hypothetical protein
VTALVYLFKTLIIKILKRGGLSKAEKIKENEKISK